VLALTPAPLQTAGERALFAELARWDTGGAVRAAVVASLPFSDGVLNRRLSDAVLLVPEGLAVVRIVEVVRQTGVVTARPDGAWTIGPGTGPGDVLQLGGGGSTPLDGLMRAGMEAAMRLRRAGLEPGRIARLTVLVGDLTGLDPADGDLGEGDQVALMEPRSLLLGIARASRYSGVDNPRLWTTADVRAALEALGLEGRGPTVDQLNGEGFPYSPYVLRRPELLAPATMTAASTAAPAPAEPAAAPSEPAPSPIAAAVAAQAAAAQAAPSAPSAEPVVHPTGPALAPPPGSVFARQAVPASPVRDTVAVGAPPQAPVDETDGIGGLFAHAEAATPAPPSLPPVPRTAVLPAQPNVRPEPAPPSSGGRRTGLLIAVAVLVVALLALGGVLLLDRGGSPDGGDTAGGSSGAAASSSASGPQLGFQQQVDGVAYTLQAVDVTDTCRGHGYGKVGESFDQADCVGLARGLYSAEVDGRAMIAAVSHVRMPDSASARALKALADTNNTGNVSDLLREGAGYVGAPDALHDAEYASAVSGSVVTIVETSWVDQDAGGTSDALNSAASSGLVLQLPDPPTS